MYDTLLETPTVYGEPYKPSTINTHLKDMRTMFSFAVKAGITKSNPFLGFPFLDISSVPRHLTEEEEVKLREYIHNSASSWHRDFFEFGLATGIRRSEIIDTNVNRIKEEKINGEVKTFLHVIGKGTRRFKEVTRWVPIDDALDIVKRRIEIINDPNKLNEILFYSKGNLGKVHRERAQAGYLFFEISSKNSVNAFFRKARQKCKLHDAITIHSLRHTFAVRALESRRLDIYGLSRVLGHRDVKTTEIYLDATPKIISMYK